MMGRILELRMPFGFGICIMDVLHKVRMRCIIQFGVLIDQY